jgi:hypothetical protein
MKIALQQPYFFPYLGYFDLMARVDRFIVFDTGKYTKQSWMNRNRIAHAAGGWQYATLPVRKARDGTPVSTILAVDPSAAMTRLIGQLHPYRAARAPHVDAVEDLVRRTFAEPCDPHLTAINVRALTLVCEYLAIDVPIALLSRENVTLPPVDGADAWGALLSVALGAEEYLNLPGGESFFDRRKYESRGVKLSFVPYEPFRYDTGSLPFVEHLSILDVLAWNARETVRAELLRRATATAG